MKPETLFAELSFPLRSAACALAMLGFFLLLTLAAHAGLLGLWLAIVVVPAMFRFLIIVAEARANGVDVEPPGIELFTLGSHAWTLFAVVPALALALFVSVARVDSPILASGIALIGAALLPAMLAVLIITHSPLQSLNPGAFIGVVRRLGVSYLMAPAVLLLTGLAGFVTVSIPWLGRLLALYILCAFHAVLGALIREHGLIDDIEIPEDESVRAGQDDKRLRHERQLSLNHAYALFSRGNRSGAMDYLGKWLADDPDPRAARAWFQEQMILWDDIIPALWFGQAHLAALLAEGEKVRAVKLMLRLKGVDDRFHPADPELAAAIDAAQSCGNPELVRALEAARPGVRGL